MATTASDEAERHLRSCVRVDCFLALLNGACRRREHRWVLDADCDHPHAAPQLPPAELGVHTVTILASSLALANADYSWRSKAICKDTDPDLFFPVGTTGQALVQIARAKEVCGECPVRVECLDYALETNQDSGIWGGLAEEERRNIRRQRAARQRAYA